MKRLLLSALILLCCIAQAAAWMNVTTVGGGVPAAAGCASGTVAIGDADLSGSASFGADADYIIYSGYTASESCTIDRIVIHLANNGTASRGVRAALYSSTGSAPDTRLAQSAEVMSGGTSQAADIVLTISGTSITASTHYWIALWINGYGGILVADNGDVANGTGRSSNTYSQTGDFPASPSFSDWERQVVCQGKAN